MDTPTALATLQALLSTEVSMVKGHQANADAIQVAIKQLQGLLDTPSVDLASAQKALADATTTIAAIDPEVVSAAQATLVASDDIPKEFVPPLSATDAPAAQM
jgi:hypothetical protein